MKAKPILFSTPMVQAILEGRKTQTRRVIKGYDPTWVWRSGFDGSIAGKIKDSPYQVGDYLWVRETFIPDPPYEENNIWTISYADGETREVEPPESYNPVLYSHERWRPSIHMPKWASRLTLKITDVRVERLQDISEEDANAEGCNLEWYSDNAGTENLWPCEKCQGQLVHGAFGANYGVTEVDCSKCDTSKKMFRQLWQSINGAHSWEDNPWVWCVSFEVINKNISEVLNEPNN